MMGFSPNALRDEQGAQGTQEALTLSFSNSPLMTHDCMSREHDTLLTACPHALLCTRGQELVMRKKGVKFLSKPVRGCCNSAAESATLVAL